MYNTRSSLYDRCLEKTPEQVFINSLRKEFELSPAESQGILELAKACLFGTVPKTLGKIKILWASLHAKHGKPLNEQDMVEVELTLDNSFGTHEFLELCKPLDTEPVICGNVGSGTIEEMSKWVEYLNFNGISPMAGKWNLLLSMKNK